MARSQRKRKRPREKRTFRFTREGKAFLAVTFGVGIAAVNTGNNLLYLVLGLMLSLLLVSGVMSELALRRVRAARRVPERLFAGSASLIEITLHNDKRWLPSFSLEVEDRATAERTERRCYFLKVRPRSKQTAAYRRTPARRGILRLSGYRIGTRYPFGLIEKARVIPDPDELLVYPALVRADADAATLAADRAEVPSGRPGRGQDVVGIREHRPEDEARDIHWRRTAALGRLAVRERERDAVSRLLVVLDHARPDGDDDAPGAWDEAFEHEVSRAAALVASALHKGMAAEVRVRGGGSPLVLPGSPPDPIWRFLALLEPASAASAPPLPAAPARVRVARLVPRPTAIAAGSPGARGDARAAPDRGTA